MRWSIVVIALLLIPTSPGQSGPALSLEIADHAFDYGPEAWKDDPQSIEDQGTFTTQASNWAASLGLHLDANVSVTPRDGPIGADWDFDATLTDGATTVTGRVMDVSGDTVWLRFDVDGQRQLPGQASISPMTAGIWTLRIEASQPDGTSQIPKGSGQVQLATQSASFSQVALPDMDPLPGVAVPEHLLPHIAEVGPGPNVWMPLASRTPGAFDVTMQSGRPGQVLTWVGYFVDSVAPSIQPGAGSPLEPYVPGTSEASITWTRNEFGISETDADGLATIRIGLRNITAELMIIAAFDDLSGGLGVAAVGVAATAPRITAIEAPDPGSEGDLVVRLTGPEATAQNLLPGQIHALQQGTPGTTGADVAGMTLASGLVVYDSEATLRGDLDTRPIRASGLGSYTLLAFTTINGDYGGHAGMVRGVDADLVIPTLGQDRESTLTARLANPGGDGRLGADPALAFRADMRLEMAGDLVEARSITVPEGGILDATIPITPSEAGSIRFDLLIDSGDIRHEVQRSETVLDSDAFDKAGKKWYDPDRLTPGPTPVLFLMGLLWLVGRKR